MLKNAKDQIKCRFTLWKTRQCLRSALYLINLRGDNKKLKDLLQKEQPNGINFSGCYNEVASICGRRYAKKNKKFFDHFDQQYLAYISK